MVKTSLEKGQEYDMMEKSIVISFVNGIQFPESRKIHTRFFILEEEEHILMSDRLEFHYIEMGKINPEIPVEELTQVEKLAAYMLYAGDKSKEDYVQKLIEKLVHRFELTEEQAVQYIKDVK